MENKTYIISGATGGIGKSVVDLLYKNKANIIMISNNNEKLQALKEKYPNTIYFLGDILDEKFFEESIKKSLEIYDSIDGYVHCIGSILLKPLHLTSFEEWKKTIDINLNSAFIAVKSLLKVMLNQKYGSIVLFSSVAAQTGMINHTSISAAKAGIEGFIRSTAITYASRGIRINGISPGLVETPLSEFLWKNENSRKISENMHPLGRLGKPEDIANGVIFLLDEKNNWITGQIISIDGGLSIGRSSKI